MYKLLHTSKVIFALLQREWVILKKNVKDSWVNALCRVGSIYIGIGMIGHLLGFDASIASDVLTGAFISVYISRCFGVAIADSYDRQYARFIDYLRLLPLTTRGLLASFILRYMMTVGVSSLPLLIAAKLVLGNQIQFMAIHWGVFFVVYSLTLLLISTFFASIIFFTSFDWMRFNIWQRILIPLNSFGCVMYAWHKVYGFNPMIARMMLANPVVYLTEGVRSTLLVQGDYIGAWYCAGGLAVWCIIWLSLLFGPIAWRIEKGKV